MIKDILQSGTPEECGVKAEWVENLLDRFEEKGLMMHSVLLARGGKVFAEGAYAPFRTEDKHRMYSVSKSFSGTAIGALIGEGKLSLDDRIVRFFQDKLPKRVHPYIAEMTVRDLLCMQTPFDQTTYIIDYAKAITAEDWVGSFFTATPSHPAGTFFRYDTSASVILCAIVERLTGKPFLEYLKDQFLREIGFSEDAWCIRTPEGTSSGGSGVICTARDMARLAQVYLNGGIVNGRQALPAEYVREATSRQVDNASDGVRGWINGNGYGYQIWRTHGNGFAFNGMGCQFAFCFPETGLLFVCTADNQGNGNAGSNIFEAVWHEIAEKLEDQLPANPAADARLEERLQSLSCCLPAGEMTSPRQAEINGQWYEMAPNPMKIARLMLEWKGKNGIFHYVMDGEEKSYPFGMGFYALGDFPETSYYGDTIGTPSGRPYPCMAAGVWTEDEKFVLRTYLIGDYLGNMTATFGLRGDELGLDIEKTAEWFLNEYAGMAGGRKACAFQS